MDHYFYGSYYCININGRSSCSSLYGCFSDPHHLNIKLHVARPGENKRILPVKEITEPRARADGRAAFPGRTGGIALSGEGTTYALKGMAVTAVGKYASATDAVLDMSGPGAELTHYSKLIHLVFTAENVDPAENNDLNPKKNEWYRLGSQLLAEYLGRTVVSQEPDEWEIYDYDKEISPSLPKVAIVLQLSAAWLKDGFNTIIYGRDVLNMYPTMLHPNEILDGAVCQCSLKYPSGKMYTYCYQNLPIIKEVYAEHGKTMNLKCVITDVNPAISDEKVRASNQIAQIAKMMDIDAAVVMGMGIGHAEVDFFTTINRLEKAGIKCVGHCGESPGHGNGMQSKVTLDPAADAIVSSGTDFTVIDLPPMGHIIGDLGSIGRDPYAGAWAYDAEYGPSLRDDGSLRVDTCVIPCNDGNAGWSYKTVKDY